MTRSLPSYTCSRMTIGGLEDLAVVVVGDQPLVRPVPEERLEHERDLDGAPDETPQPPVAAGGNDDAVELVVERYEETDLLFTPSELPVAEPLHLPGQPPQPGQLP